MVSWILDYYQPLSVSLFWSVIDISEYCQLFSQRGYEIIELLCFEILGGDLGVCWIFWGDLYAGGTCTERIIGGT